MSSVHTLLTCILSRYILYHVLPMLGNDSKISNYNSRY
jgi:hypothetical protein